MFSSLSLFALECVNTPELELLSIKEQSDLMTQILTDDNLYDLDSAHKKAKDGKKYLLVMVSANWCVPCKMLKASLFPNTKFPHMLSDLNLSFGIAKPLDRTGRKEYKKATLLDLEYKKLVSSFPSFLLINKDSIEKLEKGLSLVKGKDYIRIWGSSFVDNSGQFRSEKYDKSERVPMDIEIKRAIAKFK